MAHIDSHIHNTIMRRVYYAFALRIATHPLVLHGVLFAFALYGFSVMVHVASVIENFRSIEVSRVDDFIFNALTHTDFLTLMFMGLMFFTIISLQLNLRLPRWNGMQTA